MDPVEVDRGRRKGFSSAFVLFDFGAIAVKVPANQTIISGDDGGFGQLIVTERKTGKIFSGAVIG